MSLLKAWSIRLALTGIVAFIYTGTGEAIGYFYSAYAALSVAVIPLAFIVFGVLWAIASGKFEKPEGVSEENWDEVVGSAQEWKAIRETEPLITLGSAYMLLLHGSLFAVGWTWTAIFALIGWFGSFFLRAILHIHN